MHSYIRLTQKHLRICMTRQLDSTRILTANQRLSSTWVCLCVCVCELATPTQNLAHFHVMWPPLVACCRCMRVCVCMLASNRCNCNTPLSIKKKIKRERVSSSYSSSTFQPTHFLSDQLSLSWHLRQLGRVPTGTSDSGRHCVNLSISAAINVCSDVDWVLLEMLIVECKWASIYR